MLTHSILRFSFFVAIISCFSISLFGQQVSILNSSINTNGQIQLEVTSNVQSYYILQVRQHVDSMFDISTSITMGQPNTLIIEEPLGHYPLSNYQVLEYAISSPFDTDTDGFDDITEFQNAPYQSVFNAADSINLEDGLVMIESLSTFQSLSVTKDEVQWSEFLNGQEFLKYIITDFYTTPKVYFINSNKHDLHVDFSSEFDIDLLNDSVKKGQIIYHPNTASEHEKLGVFAFNYSNGYPQNFDIVQKSYELIAANMPFIENNLFYYITENNKSQYYQDSTLYQNSRVSILFEDDVYQGINYLGLHPAEGFGFFHQLGLNEIPGSKDIVLYSSIPNSLPRVGGIITSVIQTPLSHVNLRAIQNNIPNAFIRYPLLNDSIANLLNDYVYLKVEPDKYFIRKASLEEVNKWFEDIRPSEEQTPPLNLSYTNILPLDEIGFNYYSGFGAKCANVASMRSFGFPDLTIPNGFGVPFYFYQEFMKHNHLFEDVETLINDANFISDRNIRNDMLKAFRSKVKAASMPTWMLDDLEEMQLSFPSGTSIRCRSSSNNEDLAGFNGAGLYTSKTQHPDEGHISKSIKQVYASLWNLRAFEEREFYRINHFSTSMGVLCHPNYSDEKANGVGVSTDPIYTTSNTFYLNTQLGDGLITNPDVNSVPEEILLNNDLSAVLDYSLVAYSNLMPTNAIIMDPIHLNQMREYLSVIHSKFETLYDAVGNNTFAMDIEYKITIDNQLIIKQARPWVSYEQRISENNIGDSLVLNIYPNPAQDFINVQCAACNVSQVKITNLLGQQFYEHNFSVAEFLNMKISTKELPKGMYILTAVRQDETSYYSKSFIRE